MKKILTAVSALLLTAGMLTGCASSDGHAQTQTTEQQDPSEITEAVECIHVYDEGVITKDASCEVEGEMLYTCTKCGYSETKPTMPWTHNYEDGKCTLCGALKIPSIGQVDELTITAVLQSQEQPTTVVFARKPLLSEEGIPCGSCFYVCTENNDEQTEYLYRITDDQLMQYLRGNDGVVRNSDLNNEATAQTYGEQLELFQTFVDAQGALNLDTAPEPDLHPELPLTSITIGDDVLEMTEEDVLYYSLGDEGGYAGLHRDTNALVVLVDAEGNPMLSVTELTLNDATRMDDLLKKAEAAPLLAPEIPFHEEPDAFRVDCLIYEQDGASEKPETKPLSLTMLRTEENRIVYDIETQQHGKSVTMIYEIATDGSVTGYRRTEDTGTFQPVTDTDIKTELKQQLELATMFTDYTSLLAGCQYEYANQDLFRVEEGTMVYQVLNKNISKGYLAIDSASGILEGLYDEKAQPILVVQLLETENVTLDNYK